MTRLDLCGPTHGYVHGQLGHPRDWALSAKRSRHRQSAGASAIPGYDRLVCRGLPSRKSDAESVQFRGASAAHTERDPRAYLSKPV